MVNQFTSNLAFKKRKYFPRKCFNVFSFYGTIEEQILFYNLNIQYFYNLNIQYFYIFKKCHRNEVISLSILMLNCFFFGTESLEVLHTWLWSFFYFISDKFSFNILFSTHVKSQIFLACIYIFTWIWHASAYTEVIPFLQHILQYHFFQRMLIFQTLFWWINNKLVNCYIIWGY